MKLVFWSNWTNKRKMTKQKSKYKIKVSINEYQGTLDIPGDFNLEKLTQYLYKKSKQQCCLIDDTNFESFSNLMLSGYSQTESNNDNKKKDPIFTKIHLETLGSSFLRNFCHGKEGLKIYLTDPRKAMGANIKFCAIDVNKSRTVLIKDILKLNQGCKFEDGLTLIGHCLNSKCTQYKYNVSCNLGYCKNFKGNI